jgi:hypothetical protein
MGSGWRHHLRRQVKLQKKAIMKKKGSDHVGVSSKRDTASGKVLAALKANVLVKDNTKSRIALQRQPTTSD